MSYFVAYLPEDYNLREPHMLDPIGSVRGQEHDGQTR